MDTRFIIKKIQTLKLYLNKKSQESFLMNITKITNIKYIFYNSFNPSISALLSKIPLKRDSNSIAIDFGLPRENFAIPEQIHSNLVKFITLPGVYKGVDGLLTDNPNLILFLKVADCVPIYLFDKRLIIFGLVHSGWRGTANKIVMNAINNLLEHHLIMQKILPKSFFGIH